MSKLEQFIRQHKRSLPSIGPTGMSPGPYYDHAIQTIVELAEAIAEDKVNDLQPSDSNTTTKVNDKAQGNPTEDTPTLTPAQMKAASKIPKPDDNPFVGQDDKQLTMFRKMVDDLISWHAILPVATQSKLVDDIMKHAPTLMKKAQIQLVSELEGEALQYYDEFHDETVMAVPVSDLEHKKQELEGKI